MQSWTPKWQSWTSNIQEIVINMYLAGGFNPSKKYGVKLDHFPTGWGENKKPLKPPTSYGSTGSIPLSLHPGAWIRQM